MVGKSGFLPFTDFDFSTADEGVDKTRAMTEFRIILVAAPLWETVHGRIMGPAFVA
jgi:hypothetical protein|tara:strand:+ start:2550 stop:2717 length:168 start_codon:yes stop_codon:yes gene_type:complete